MIRIILFSKVSTFCTIETVHSQFLEGSDRLVKIREDYQRESSRLETLRAMTERYEGYGVSIKRVMEQKDRVPGILGVVADLIRTSKRYELAVETALGGSIQNIVTSDEQTAKRMIAAKVRANSGQDRGG